MTSHAKAGLDAFTVLAIRQRRQMIARRQPALDMFCICGRPWRSSRRPKCSTTS